MESLKTEKIQVHKQRDVFITRTAIKNLTSESVVEKVVSFQFREILKALKVHSTVEISGFGTLQISQSKLRKRLKKLKIVEISIVSILEKEMTIEQRVDYEKRLLGVKEKISYLNQRLKDEIKSEGDSKRMEEPSIPS